MQTALNLMTGGLDLSPISTHYFPLYDVAEGFNAVADPSREDAIKVIIDVGAG